jgi:hypothetical protein
MGSYMISCMSIPKIWVFPWRDDGFPTTQVDPSWPGAFHGTAGPKTPRSRKRPWCGGRDSYNSCEDFYRKRTNPLKNRTLNLLESPQRPVILALEACWWLPFIGFHGSRQSTVVSNTFFTSERNPIFGIDDPGYTALDHQSLLVLHTCYSGM